MEIIGGIFILVFLHLVTLYMWSLTIGSYYGYFCATNFIDTRIPLVIICLIMDIGTPFIHFSLLPFSILLFSLLFTLGFYSKERYLYIRKFKNRNYEYQIRNLSLRFFRPYDVPKTTFYGDILYNGRKETLYIEYRGDFELMEIKCYDDNSLTKERILPYLDIEMRDYITNTYKEMNDKRNILKRKLIYGLPYPS